MDTSSPEFQAALRDHARSLGVDPDADAHLLALVQDALLADVPAGWEQGETEDGTLYYFNEDSGESIWEHPLDAHYRELVKQKKAEGPPQSKTVVEAKAKAETEVAKLEVYSFDDDSDDEVKPLAKPTANNTAASDKASRLNSLFTPQPVPSYSATSSAMTGTSTSTGSAKEAFPSSSSSSSSSSRASALSGDSGASTTTTTSRSNAAGGFGRDRSWLLDNDDDDIPTLGSSQQLPAPTATISSSFAKPTEIKDFTTTSTSRPSTASSSGSSLSYTSRLFGGPASASSSATVPSETSVSSLDLGGNGMSATGSTGKLSPRRGIASAIKGPFFQDMAAATAPSAAIEPSSVVGTTHGSVADAAKIKDLEKTTTDLHKQVDQLKRELETAKQDAKEANYLKMKANESKTKLSEKESELAKAKLESSKLQDQVQRLQDECATLAHVQQTATQQEVLDAKKAASELERRLRTSQQHASEAEDALQKSRLACENLGSQLNETLASLDRERRDGAVLQEQYASGQKETRALGDQVDKAKQESHERLEQLKREMSEQSRKFESLGLLQETMDRQAKYVKALEDKQKELLTKIAESEASETQATRATKLKDLEVQDLDRKTAALTHELEARDKQVKDLLDKLRHEQTSASEIQSKALSLQRSEDAFDRKQQLLEREKQDLGMQLRERSAALHAMESQLQKAQEEHVGVVAKLHTEIHTLESQLKQVKSQELLPLEKQRDQLVHDVERAREKLCGVEKELRTTQQELTTESSRNHQRQVEIEAWKRKEQQQKQQKETYVQEKLTCEKQLQSLQAEASTYKHDKRLEIDKLAFRLRELEAQVAQKDYEIVRVEEKFTKAEAWRLKEARRVEERDTQVLDLKEELAQLKSRNIEAENNLSIHELRREKDQLDAKLRALAQDLEHERTARAVAVQKFQDEADNLQRAVEWQLPQLAAVCVSRSNEEWTRKCNEIVKALRDDWSLKALTDRNELVQRLKQVDERRDHVEQKLKHATAECEFLRKEVHRVEDNNKVLLDQLHTVRVYMMQRGSAAVFPTTAFPSASPPPPPAPGPPQPQPQAPPPPQPVYSDFAAVNQLNTQLAVLHAQFQQLFDAHASGPSARPLVDVYSPSDRFEIPSSPPSQPRKKTRAADPFNTSSASTGSSTASLDETLAALLRRKSGPLLATTTPKDPHKEKEQLLATLEAIGSNTASGTSSISSISSTAVAPFVVSVGGGNASDTTWYQKNYWRTKYQH